MQLDINQECLVSELKTMINSHLKIPPNHQELYIMLYGKYVQMQDECSLSFYQVQEGQRIILKNPHYADQIQKEQVSRLRCV